MRSPEARARSPTLIAAEGGKVTARPGNGGRAGALSVTGLEAPRIGEIAAADGIVLHELTPQLGSLEEAFMEMTADSVEYGVPGIRPARHRSAPIAAPQPRGAAHDRRQPGSPGQLPAGHARARAPAAGFGHLMLTEWTKIRSVRSTVWTLILFVRADSSASPRCSRWLICGELGTGPAGARVRRSIADPVGTILGTGLELRASSPSACSACWSSPASTPPARSGLRCWPCPGRLPDARGQGGGVRGHCVRRRRGRRVRLVLHRLRPSCTRTGARSSLQRPGCGPWRVVGAGLYLTVLGLFALAIGALMRHTAGAITTVIGVVFVLPIIAAFLPGQLGRSTSTTTCRRWPAA